MNNLMRLVEQQIGNYVRVDGTHDVALVERMLCEQARYDLDTIGSHDRHIVIFKGRDSDGEYMGWHTDLDKNLDIIGSHEV